MLCGTAFKKIYMAVHDSGNRKIAARSRGNRRIVNQSRIRSVLRAGGSGRICAGCLIAFTRIVYYWDSLIDGACMHTVGGEHSCRVNTSYY